MKRATRGGNGTAAAMVGLGVLFVVVTVAAIVFLNQSLHRKGQIDDLRNELRVYRTAGDEADARVSMIRQRVAHEQSRSVTSHLLREIDRLHRTMDGDPSLVQFVNNGIGALTAQLDAAEREKAALQRKLKTATEALAAVEERYRTHHSDEQQRVVATLQAADEAANTAGATFEQLHAEMKEKVERYERTINDLEAEVEKLRIGLSRFTCGGHHPICPPMLPDGEIVSAFAGDDRVTINLGKGDRLLPGLTFEVFDGKRGIARDPFGDMRGKGTIQVAHIHSDTAECRIIRLTPGQTFAKGDVITNVVYDKNRVYRFFVFGEFDIDNDGKATPDERRRVNRIVTDWGGQLADEMSYEVDYVVLGERPELPDLPAAGLDALNPTQRAERDVIERRLKTLITLEGEARTLRIPILNTNRFLSLVGHVER